MLKLWLLSASLFFFTSAKFSISSFNVTIKNPYRENHFVTYLIQYPTENQEGGFPLLVWRKGITPCQAIWYQYLGRYLVPEGYVYFNVDSVWVDILPEQVLTIGAEDQLLALDYLYQQNKNSSSPLFGKFNGKSAVGGHSFGGASSMIAMTLKYVGLTFDVVVGYSPCGISPSTPTNVTVPMLFWDGSHDCICPVTENIVPIYSLTPSPCKFLGVITNGTHCGFCDMFLAYPSCVVVEERLCKKPEKEILYQKQAFIAERYVLMFLDAMLKHKGDKEYLQRLWDEMKVGHGSGVLSRIDQACGV